MAGSSASSSGASAISTSHEEQRILELCTQYKQGITNSVIENDMKHLTKQMVVDLLNKLLAQQKLLLQSRPDKTLVYKIKDPVKHHRMQYADKEEQVVYEIIERSGSKGIWSKRIKNESNLHQNIVDKVIKRLEGKKSIKAINSVQAPKKKMYLVASVEPDHSLTGGAFYSNNTFDSAFVDVLKECCLNYLRVKLKKAQSGSASDDGPVAKVNAAMVTAKEVQEYITEVQVSKIKLSVEDVEKLLGSLELGRNVNECTERYVDGAEACGVRMWRAVPDWAPRPYLVSAPCGVCPMIDRCGDIGNITPRSCVYLQCWLADNSELVW